MMMLGGALLFFASLIPPDGSEDNSRPTISEFSQTIARAVQDEPLRTRQLLYGKFNAFANWVATTNQVTNTAQVDAVYTSARLGVSVPELGRIIQAEATRRELLKPVPLDDARSDWVAFLEELALGCRWAKDDEAASREKSDG